MIFHRNTYLDAAHNGRDYHEDLVDLFTFNRAGYRPLQLAGNWDLDERDLSFPLDPTWPDSIPNDQISNMNYTIENRIPVPPKHRSNGMIGDIITAMGKLENGDSFLIPLENTNLNRVNGAVCTARRHLLNKRFVTRKIATPPAGLRVWRVE